MNNDLSFSQMSLFDYNKSEFTINKPIRLIELFA